VAAIRFAYPSYIGLTIATIYLFDIQKDIPQGDLGKG